MKDEYLAIASPDVVWDWNIETNHVWWSRNLEARLGYAVVEVRPTIEWWFERIHAADVARVRHVVTELLAGDEGSASAEYRFLRTDGTYATILGRLAIARREGKAVRVVGVMIDITEHRRTEQTLRGLEQRHRQILDAITDWVLVKGPGSKIVWANKAFCDIYGMTNETLQGLVDAPFNEPDNTIQYIQDDAQVFNTGETLDIPDEPVTRHDGRVLRVHTVKSAIFNDDGNVVMTVGVSRDLTDRKRMEAQLRLADRMVSVGTLAAGVAHEINNPLSFVMSNLDLVAEELRAQADVVTAPPMGELLELINEARDGAERVRTIVRGLKTFSRADEERRRPLEVAAVIELSINMAWNEIRHRARLVKDFGTAPLVEADETRLAQVFINLLVNAAQALPEGNADTNQIRILVSTDSAGRAIVEIHDTGAGIPPASLQHIFDPFFTTKHIGEGTGLGLSICQGIVTGLGGEITVESALGVGTTFRVALPPARAPEATTVDHAPAALVPAGGRRGRVLVVDDDVMVGKALARALARDHDVEFVSEGRLALERIRAGERFDVFFCDLMMPALTGMDIHRELAKIAPDQLDRMVLITGGTFTPGARQFLDTVTNERMDKPFDTQNVRALVRRLVR